MFKNEDKTEFNQVIYDCCYIIKNLGNLFDPFIPFAAQKLRAEFGVDRVEWKPVELENGKHLEKMPVLFERMTDQDVL